jgi:ribosomal protein L37AE/L43A
LITVSQKYELLVKLLGPGDIDKRAVNAQFWCPFCKHHDAKKRKLAVRLADGVTHCWVCNWSAKSPAKLVSVLGAHKLLPDLTRAFGDGGPAVEDEPVESVAEAELPSDFTLVCDEIDNGVRNPDKLDCIEYLKKRGVSYAAAKHFRLGVSATGAFRRRVVFPSFDAAGELNYVTARAIDDSTTFKYFNTQRQRSSLVFNEVDVSWSRELVLVEGPFDLTSCVGMNAVPMLGSWLDENYLLFNRIVLNRTPVCLAFDPDAARKQAMVATRFLRYDIPVRAVSWAGHALDTDPSKVGPSAFRQMVKTAKTFDESTAFLSRLNRTLDSMRLS